MQKRGQFIFRDDESTYPGIYGVRNGSALESIPLLENQSVDSWITSPPYYHQVDYGVAGQSGMERSVADYVQGQRALAEMMLEKSRPTATLFWVVRDSSNGSGGAGGDFISPDGEYRMKTRGASEKDYPKKAQLLIPERTRIAFTEAGWVPRMSIIWDKNDPRRGAVDRCSYSYEQVLVFGASPNHYWDRDSVLQEYAAPSIRQLAEDYTGQGRFSYGAQGQEDPSAAKRRMMKAMQRKPGAYLRGVWRIASGNQPCVTMDDGEVVRAIAAFPTLLAEICVNLGSPTGGLVVDPYSGFGTTLLAAARWGRRSLGIELSPKFAAASMKRISDFFQNRCAPCGSHLTAKTVGC